MVRSVGYRLFNKFQLFVLIFAKTFSFICRMWRLMSAWLTWSFVRDRWWKIINLWFLFLTVSIYTGSYLTPASFKISCLSQFKEGRSGQGRKGAVITLWEEPLTRAFCDLSNCTSVTIHITFITFYKLFWSEQNVFVCKEQLWSDFFVSDPTLPHKDGQRAASDTSTTIGFVAS